MDNKMKFLRKIERDHDAGTLFVNVHVQLSYSNVSEHRTAISYSN